MSAESISRSVCLRFARRVSNERSIPSQSTTHYGNKARSRGANHAATVRALASDQIDIWTCNIDALSDSQSRGLYRVMSRHEVARYRRFKSIDSAEQFAAGRALTRAALSAYRNFPPRAWQFSFGEWGRPEIVDPYTPLDLHFNISHTSGFVAVAISRCPEIGIDVERVDRSVDIEAVARAVFSERELVHFLRCGTAGWLGDARGRFFDLWTLKEAYIKARGLGFSLPPQSFEIAAHDGRLRLQRAPTCDQRPERWQFRLLSPSPALRMSIAAANPYAVRLRHIGWTPG